MHPDIFLNPKCSSRRCWFPIPIPKTNIFSKKLLQSQMKSIKGCNYFTYHRSILIHRPSYPRTVRSLDCCNNNRYQRPLTYHQTFFIRPPNHTCFLLIGLLYQRHLFAKTSPRDEHYSHLKFSVRQKPFPIKPPHTFGYASLGGINNPVRKVNGTASSISLYSTLPDPY